MALKGLSKVTLPDKGTEHSLADEVDLITAVSGGSFTAAYFGLFSNQIFEDFEQRILKRNIQGELTTAVLFNPVNWVGMASPYLERRDLATEFYDEAIFDQRTFAELIPANGPFVVINATELTLGTRF